jgi:hypothetical protein
MGQRRKYVTQTLVTEDVQPPDDNQHIVKCLGTRGGNIVEVCIDEREAFRGLSSCYSQWQATLLSWDVATCVGLCCAVLGLQVDHPDAATTRCLTVPIMSCTP